MPGRESVCIVPKPEIEFIVLAGYDSAWAEVLLTCLGVSEPPRRP